MRLPLKKILEKLGVDYELSAYETAPWLLYDEGKQLTCSAEIRMGPGAEDMEAEIQLIRDDDAEDDSIEEKTEEEGKDGKKDGGGDSGKPPPPPVPIMKTLKPGVPRQVMIMRFMPLASGDWEARRLLVHKEEFYNAFDKWDEKGCDFFRACVEALQMGEIPDFDEMITQHLKDESFWGAGGNGRIGRKSPNIKPGQLMGMNKGMKP